MVKGTSNTRNATPLTIMIKIMLKRRKEGDTYLAADRRHHRSTQFPLQLMKAAVPAESYTLIHFHSDLRTPAMSFVSSQVGVALVPSF